MRKWTCTRIVWKCSLGMETSIPVTDWHEPDKKYFHKVHAVQAYSLPEGRKATLVVDIKRVAICPTTMRDVVCSRLNMLAEHGRDVSVCNLPNSSVFTIIFTLRRNESFCDTAIAIVKKLLENLGVADEHGYHLGGFGVSQKTFIRHEQKWVDFAWWLRRVRHDLPPDCPPDEIMDVLAAEA